MAKHSLTKDKILYSIMIVLAYMFARSIPLYGIDVSHMNQKTIDAEILISQTISGDLNKCSIMALGIAPYMLASIPISIINACRSSDAKANTSPISMNRFTVGVMLVFCVLLAIFRLDNLTFIYTGYMLLVARFTAVTQMVAGAFLIMFLSERNKKYGIGGQTALIYVNILDGIMTNIFTHSLFDMRMPILFGVIGIVIMLVMENAEKRMPMQRIAIYNIYADKNYQAIKLNPIGIMPIMFASAFMMLPQLIAKLLLIIMPNNAQIIWFLENDTLNRPLGIIIYIVILFGLSILFSIVFLNPGELSDQMLKSGDSLVGIHAGDKTRKYLKKQIVFISLFSACVMSACMGVPLVMQFFTSIDSSLVMFPSSIMMLTGIWCNLFRELRGVRNLDSYEPFI